MIRARRLVAAATGLSCVLHSIAGAYPADVFSGGAPLQAPAQAAADAPAEDGHRVSSDGAAEYTIPIPMAPGRQGMTPSLALRYSSRGAVRGGVAMGWSLDVPVIEPDLSRGALAQHDMRSSLSRGRLIRVGAAAVQPPAGFLAYEEYRAREDAAGTRYTRVLDSAGTLSWQARTTDGRTYFFGETDASKDRPSAATSGIVLADGRFFLTRIVDRFHNEVQFTYQTVTANLKDRPIGAVRVDVELAAIEYGRNSPASLDHHARIEFLHRGSLDRCPGSEIPIGAAYDRRTGYPLYKGARRLEQIRLSVKQGATWVPRRSLALAYDEAELACNLTGSLHAPLRVLTSVTESATAPNGTVTTQPPMTFEYGRRQRELTRTVSYPPSLDLGSGQQMLSTEKAGGWPTVDAMLLDLDGDGLVDDLRSRRAQPSLDPQYCEATWKPNLGGTFGTQSPVGKVMPDRPASGRYLPVVPWLGTARADDWTTGEGREDCSLSAQFSRESTENTCGYAANYLSYRFLDMTGDGLPDLVTGLDTQRGRYKPESDSRLHPITAFCTDPLRCGCSDLGSCPKAGGGEQLCKVIDAAADFWGVAAFAEAQQCDGICCPIGGEDDISDFNAEPIQAKDEGQQFDTSQSFFILVQKHFGQNRAQSGSLGIVIDQEQTGESDASSGRANPLCQMYPETRCGHYILRVYDNLGGGRFADAPRTITAPIPLETDRPTSRLGAGHLAISGSWHGFVDLDGDRRLDALYKQPDWANAGSPVEKSFRVFRGTGNGEFEENGYLWRTDNITADPRIHVSGTRSDVWSFPIPTGTGVRETPTSSVTATFTSVTLEDMNGDGLPDYVDARESATNPRGIRVLFNTGAGFEPVTAQYRGTRFTGSTTQPLQWLQEDQQWQDRVLGTSATARGFSRATWRTIDLDHDGLLDLVRLPPVSPDDPYAARPYFTGYVAWQPEVYFNIGDNFVRATNVPLDFWHALARVRVTDNGNGLQGGWQVLTDFVDLNGDGLPEAVLNNTYAQQCRLDVAGSGRWICSTTNNALTEPDDGQALRALRLVKNGKGAEIEYAYAAVRGATGRVPHAVWAVTSMTVRPGPDADGTASPAMVTRAAYDGGAYRQNLDGEWGFRGFARVSITEPSGARTVTTRDFSQDYAGLVTEERVYDRPGEPSHAAAIATRTYEQRKTFASLGTEAITSYHLTTVAKRTCGATQTEVQCASAGALARQTHEWTTLPATGTPIVHVAWRTETTPGFGMVAGAVGKTVGSRLVDEPGKFWLVTESELTWSRGPGGTAAIEGETYFYFDPMTRVPIAISARTSGTEFAVTTRQYDATGNIEREKSPRYFQAAGPWTVFTYDPTKRFIATTTNALGHTTVTTTDPATGVALEARGPNQKAGVKDGVVKTIDGFGRILTEHQYVDDATLGYRLEQVARFTYVDTAAPRTSVTEERANGNGTWMRHRSETDGLGRSVRIAEYDGAAEASVTRLYYDAAGSRVMARVPKPGQIALAFVDWIYEYDALGRITAEREPSRTGCTGALGTSGWCGRRWIYDGRATTEEDVVGTAGGSVGKKRTTTDFLGRLERVEELQSSGTWAATTYQRDGNGHVIRTVNADNVVTVATHDQLGRRTAVARGGKTWHFTYDLDNHLVGVLSPRPTGAPIEHYLTTLAYDELGRLTSHVAAERDWGSAEHELLGIPSVIRTYDTGDNGIGRLAQVSQESGSIDYRYDAGGRVTREVHAFAILGDTFIDQRTVERTYDVQGRVVSVTNADASTPAGATRFVYSYDGRGQPANVRWFEGAIDRGIVHGVERNASGRVYRRSTVQGGQVTSEATSAWDDAGRLTQLEVLSRLPGAPSLTTRARQTATFDGASDISHLTSLLDDGIVPGSPHQAVYSYDRQHRLTSATGPSGYAGAFQYTAGGRVTRAVVTAASAPAVHVRDVTYQYADKVSGSNADPDAPVRLVSSGGTTWMSLDYDLAGNATSRTQGVTFTHLYDGLDRQRRTSRSDGSSELYWYGPDGERSLVATRDASGAVTSVKWTVGETELWYGPSANVTKQLALASVAGAQVRIEDRANLEVLYHDARGHLLAGIAGNGALEAGFRYGPYGELLEARGSQQADFTKRFNGKERDETSGLTYYGLRYYDERTLAWTQSDPRYRMTVEEAGDEPRRASLYGFSLGNPVSMVDPDGGDPIEQVLEFADNLTEASGILISHFAEKKLYNGKLPRPGLGAKAGRAGAWVFTLYVMYKSFRYGAELRRQRDANRALEAEVRTVRRNQVLPKLQSLIKSELERRQAGSPNYVTWDFQDGVVAKMFAAIDKALEHGRSEQGFPSNHFEGSGIGRRFIGEPLEQPNWVVDDVDLAQGIEAAIPFILDDMSWVAHLPGASYPEPAKEQKKPEDQKP